MHAQALPFDRIDVRGPACGTAYLLAVPEVRTKPAWRESAIQSVAGPAPDGRWVLSPLRVARRFPRPTSRPCHPDRAASRRMPTPARGRFTLPRSLQMRPDPVFRARDFPRLFP